MFPPSFMDSRSYPTAGGYFPSTSSVYPSLSNNAGSFGMSGDLYNNRMNSGFSSVNPTTLMPFSGSQSQYLDATSQYYGSGSIGNQEALNGSYFNNDTFQDAPLYQQQPSVASASFPMSSFGPSVMMSQPLTEGFTSYPSPVNMSRPGLDMGMSQLTQMGLPTMETMNPYERALSEAERTNPKKSKAKKAKGIASEVARDRMTSHGNGMGYGNTGMGYGNTGMGYGNGMGFGNNEMEYGSNGTGSSAKKLMSVAKEARNALQGYENDPTKPSRLEILGPFLCSLGDEDDEEYFLTNGQKPRKSVRAMREAAVLRNATSNARRY